MVEGLPAVEGKQALSVGTLSRDVGGVEGLREEEDRGGLVFMLGRGWDEVVAKPSGEAYFGVAGLQRVLAL